MSYLIDKQLAQRVINYLGAQPYAQVCNMVKAMESMPDYDEVVKSLRDEWDLEFNRTEAPEVPDAD